MPLPVKAREKNWKRESARENKTPEGRFSQGEKSNERKKVNNRDTSEQ